MKIGSGAARALPGARGEESGVNSAFERRTCSRIPLGVVADAVAPQAIAFFVVLERLRELPRVLERLAEREMEVKAILRR